MTSTGGFGFKNRNFKGFFPGKKPPKNHFWTAIAKTAAKSSIITFAGKGVVT
jgi:hypothetical protein